MQPLQQHLSPDEISDYLRGELEANVEASVEHHIGSCLVCARQLQAEAQLETLLFEAAAQSQPASDRRAWTPWQRVATVAAAAVASAAALLLVLAPPQFGLGDAGSNATATPAMASNLEVSNPFLNDSALCFPSVIEDAEVCAEPLAIAMTTDPDDYLSPFESDTGWSRASGHNICVAEEDSPICEPIAG